MTIKRFEKMQIVTTRSRWWVRFCGFSSDYTENISNEYSTLEVILYGDAGSHLLSRLLGP